MVYVMFRVRKLEGALISVRRQQGTQLSIDDVTRIVQEEAAPGQEVAPEEEEATSEEEEEEEAASEEEEEAASEEEEEVVAEEEVAAEAPSLSQPSVHILATETPPSITVA